MGLRVTLLARTIVSSSLRNHETLPATWPFSKYDADALAEAAGRNCYQSWDNPSNRTNEEYIGNIIAKEHFSVLEHSGFTVLIEGVSRSLTHELVRHRHMSFSQLSQRYFDESKHEIVVPPLLEGSIAAEEVLREIDKFVTKKYMELIAIGEARVSSRKVSKHAKKKMVREAARAALPNMVETKIVVSANHRTWREFFEKRGSVHAEQEIRRLAIEIFKIAKSLAPATYQDMNVYKVEGYDIPIIQRLGQL